MNNNFLKFNVFLIVLFLIFAMARCSYDTVKWKNNMIRKKQISDITTVTPEKRAELEAACERILAKRLNRIRDECLIPFEKSEDAINRQRDSLEKTYKSVGINYFPGS